MLEITPARVMVTNGASWVMGVGEGHSVRRPRPLLL